MESYTFVGGAYKMEPLAETPADRAGGSDTARPAGAMRGDGGAGHVQSVAAQVAILEHEPSD
eukprot:1181251-Prorocentrum_minimum.AAC.1